MGPFDRRSHCPRLGDKAVRRLVANGQLVRLRRGHYRRPLPSDSEDRRTWPIGEPELRHRFLLEATRSVLAGDSVFSHVSAASLHGLPVPARLPPEEVTEVDGLPVTSLVRTVVDLTSLVMRRQAEACWRCSVG